MHNINAFQKIAKLSLLENELAQVSDCAEMLINSFNELDKIDTGGILALVTVLDVVNVLREDTATDSNLKAISRDELLSSAPEQYDGFFQVPKTLE